MTLRCGVNLMAPLWAGEPAMTGAPLMARRARLLGIMADGGADHVMLGDHVMFQGGLGNDGLIDAASVLTASGLAAYLSVYLLVLRHPLLVARQLATLAQLAPGRLTVGVGVAGDDRREVVASGVDPATRGRRMDESMLVLRRLLAGGTVSHEGEFFALDGAAIVPAPTPAVPLIVGGRSDAALRRAGRLGDGWLGIWTSATRFAASIRSVEDHAATNGRTDVDWQHGMTFWCGFGPDRRQARERVAPVMEGFYRIPFDNFERYIPHGTPRDVAEFIQPYVEAGATTVNLIGFGADEEQAARAATEVIRDLRTAEGAPR